HFDAHVMEGYEFLMESCTSLFAFPPDVGTDVGLHTDQAGDKICLFGFSSGAYTARALAGM
ncbi:hypothetical protein M404DRAFT_1009456, partial [Pisolithus tinctorius Marx 270]